MLFNAAEVNHARVEAPPARARRQLPEEAFATGAFMEVSIIIPTCRRAAQLRACLQGLIAQDIPTEQFEVLVGVDGRDTGETAAFDQVAGHLNGNVKVIEKCGPAATRNVLIRQARGRLLLMLNDDVIPHPQLVRSHLQAQRRDPGMILGAAPWAVAQPDRLLDRLVRETSLIFFYDQMNGDDPQRDWGFRHAWTLNLSLPSEPVQAVDGFCEALTLPVYEDIELAWRLHDRFTLPVLYRPEAMVTHVHRYEAVDLLKRCIVLGHQAWALATAAPRCAADIFARDVLADASVAESGDFIESHEQAAAAQVPDFLELAHMPADAIGGADESEPIKSLYQQQATLRKFLWCHGHVAAAEARPLQQALAWVDEQTAAIAP